jgi:glycosyltransferase involved in cell wall biosynthesis
MSQYKFKYTILVPTHQRGALLRETLRGLLLQEHDDYQIVVSNNFSQDGTRSVLAEFAGDPRIRVVHTDRKMSMPVHWEFAMGYVEGEYIIILGDDDGVRPDFLAALDLVIAETGANIIKFKTALYYHNDWPDEKRNTFEYDSRCSNRYFDVDKRTVVAEFCDFTSYAIFPNLLQTCFSFDLYRRVKKRCGTMFVGAPDWSCPFVLLMDESAKLVYIDSTLGFGGRSQMSNAAYYVSGANQFQNDRITDFVNELTAEFRFPYHVPQITTAGNFTPAAFSYAKHFYAWELDGFVLNPFEMAKVVQQDIAEEAVSKRHRFWTPSEFEAFRDFVFALPKERRDVIVGMAGYFSAKGRVRLLLKLLKRRLKPLTPEFLRAWRTAIRNAADISRYPWTSKVDVSSFGITNGHQLMRRFSEIVSQSDECQKANHDPLVSGPSLSLRGQLHLPVAAPNRVDGRGAGGRGSASLV